jgi:invasion protein IalB
MSCTLEQRLVVQATGQPFLTLTVQVPAEPRRPFLAAQTPLGLHLPSGLSLKIDAGQALTVAIERCDQNGCYAGGPIADDFLAALKAGQTLNVTMRAPDGQDLSLAVPLAGFAPGYDAIR